MSWNMFSLYLKKISIVTKGPRRKRESKLNLGNFYSVRVGARALMEIECRDTVLSCIKATRSFGKLSDLREIERFHFRKRERVNTCR
jgi:hypothetical protein